MVVSRDATARRALPGAQPSLDLVPKAEINFHNVKLIEPDAFTFHRDLGFLGKSVGPGASYGLGELQLGDG